MTDPITRLNAALEGRYKIEREIGEGGMATVYLAEDLRHERKVALKVLKPELAAVVGAERFLAEIKTTANLQHPHILPLFDSGQAESFLYYVMPYVEGDTLRDKIDREKQLGIEEALDITKKVASALDYAHEHGVIHRDIKPGNILLSSTDEPTVADFGIALAVAQAGGGRVTETGLSVGTPHYMSPEQATGDRDVDPRTDVYALGSVLYEMLIGEPPYSGTTAQAVLAKILTDPAPAPTQIRLSIPPNVDAAIRKALEKLPADRFSSAQEFSQALGDSGFRHGEEAAADSIARGGLWNPLSVAATILALVLAIGLGWSLLRPEPQQPVARFSSPFEEGQLPIGPMAFTADGSLVYVGPAESGQEQQLWIRRWADLEATPIRGTEGAVSFALSPDGTEVAFTPSPGPIRVTRLSGGGGRTLGQANQVSDWAPDGAVYFSTPGLTAVARVPAEGGDIEAITERLEGESFHSGLVLLPGGRMGVFQVWHAQNGVDSEIWAIDLDTHERRVLTPGHAARYSPTGHLLFVTADGTLMAAPIDPETAELTGTSRPVAEGLAVIPPYGESQYSVAGNGALVYRSAAVSNVSIPTWIGRDGSEEVLDGTLTGLFESPVISPDGRRLAIQHQEGGAPEDIWIYDLDQGTFARLTFGGGRNIQPFWSPDGTEVGFSSNRDGLFALYSRPADLSGEARLLLSDPDDGLYTATWSPDGTALVYRWGSATTAGTLDLRASRLDSDSALVISSTPASETTPSLSPDGRWVTYASDESGRNEVYVRPFPGPGGQSLVSVNGGQNPTWARDGTEILYLAPDYQSNIASTLNLGPASLMVATVGAESDFVVESRERLTSWPYLMEPPLKHYDVTPDGQRFLAIEVGSGVGQHILVQNFFEELRQVVPD